MVCQGCQVCLGVCQVFVKCVSSVFKVCQDCQVCVKCVSSVFVCQVTSMCVFHVCVCDK